ncbi:MAG: hypothetical protein V3T08_09375 [Gemmatimonadota bacterium]
MSNGVRFYTTKVSPEKSLQEVMGLLRKYGAQRFEMVWEDGRTTAVRFNLPVPEAAFGFLDIVLRPKVDVLGRKMRDSARSRRITPEQVERTAWRQLKGILEGMLMAVDTGMFSAGQLFFGMAEDPESKQPMWDVVCERGIAGLLPAPEIVEAEVLAVEEIR